MFISTLYAAYDVVDLLGAAGYAFDRFGYAVSMLLLLGQIATRRK